MCYLFFFLVTGIARSINPGQSLKCIKPISGQINDAQVTWYFLFIFKFYLIKITLTIHLIIFKAEKLDEDCATPLDTIKKHPVAFGRSMQSVDSGSTSAIKKSLFGIKRNMSVPNAAESILTGLIKKQSVTIGRGAPPPVPPNKPVIPPKKDLISLIKKPSVAENAAPAIDKEQKDTLLRHNNCLSNDITVVDKQEEMANN